MSTLQVAAGNAGQGCVPRSHARSPANDATTAAAGSASAPCHAAELHFPELPAQVSALLEVLSGTYETVFS